MKYKQNWGKREKQQQQQQQHTAAAMHAAFVPSGALRSVKKQ